MPDIETDDLIGADTDLFVDAEACELAHMLPQLLLAVLNYLVMYRWPEPQA